MKKFKIIAFIIGIIFAVSIADADIHPKYKKKKKEKSSLQRENTGVFDVQKNTMSNIEFFTSNYGIFGFDVLGRTGGGYWPRNSKNQYIFGGGTWFGARKKVRDLETDTVQYDVNGKPIYRSFVEVTYDPSTAESWFVPGRVTDPFQSADLNQLTKYRTYFSTDFDTEGKPFVSTDGENWPIWDDGDDIKDTLKHDRYFGHYIQDETSRNTDTYPKGPAFISQEDIFATFKDTDLKRYSNITETEARKRGYPLRIQIEHFIYSWNFGRYKDFVFLRYDFINRSRDTLMDCWHAPMMDVDIALSTNANSGARNDRVKFIDCGDVPDLNMATQWTQPDQNEGNKGFGYLGFDYLESPSVVYYRDSLGNKIHPKVSGSTDDSKYAGKMYDRNGNVVWPETLEYDNTGFVRKDRRWYPVEEQLGLVKFKNWNIADDVNEDLERYEFMSTGTQDPDNGPGDKRYLMSTGPYNMFPDDTARVVVAVIIASPAVSREATGDCDDLANLRSLSEFAQTVYDNSFQAPAPPDVCRITEWQSGNNSMMIRWNSDSEYSVDPNEKGLDFMGYKIYRSRRPEQDTFNIVEVEPDASTGYPKGKGPYGWKEIASYQVDSPFLKSHLRSGDNQNAEHSPLIDSLMVVDFGYFPESQGGGLDSMAVTVMRIPASAYVYPIDTLNGNPGSYFYSRTPDYTQTRANEYIPVIAGFNTSEFAEPWGPYFYELAKDDLNPKHITNQYPVNKPATDKPWLFYDRANNKKIFQDVLIGTLRLNRSLAAFNPIYTEEKTVKLSKSVYDEYLTKKNPSGVIYKKETVIRVHLECVLDSNGVEIPHPNPERARRGDCLQDTSYDDNGEIVWDTVDVDGPHLDTAYHMDTYRFIEDFGWAIDVTVPLEDALGTAMKDSKHIKDINASLSDLIHKGIATTEFPDFIQNDETLIPDYVEPYMTKITNNRTFLDIGDDNNDGVVSTSSDQRKTEKLLNNIKYNYKVLAFDEGDYEQPTAQKLNNAVSKSPNFKSLRPSASRAGLDSEFEIISIDEELMGGLYNFNFFSVDKERLGQFFAGDTFELEFNPRWNLSFFAPDGSEDPEADRINYATIAQNMTITNLSKNNEIAYEMATNFEPILCTPSSEVISENAQSYVRDKKPIIDTVSYDPVVLKIDSFGVAQHYEERIRSGKFSTGNFDIGGFCYSYGWDQEYFGTMGFEFDYIFKQFGGIYRPYSMEIIKGDATINMKALTNDGEDTDIIEAAQIVDFSDDFKAFDRSDAELQLETAYAPIVESFNNGPGSYELEFGDLKTEDFEFYYVQPFNAKLGHDTEVKTNVFTVPYIELKLKNVTQMNRPAIDGDSVEIKFPSELKHMKLPIAPERFTYFGSNALKPVNVPSPVALPYVGKNGADFINHYNTFAFAFVDLKNATRLNAYSNYAKYSAIVRDNVPLFDVTGVGEKEIAKDRISTFYSGLQGDVVGRYYLTGTASDGSKVEFINVVNIGGTRFIFDRVNAGGSHRVVSTIDPWDWGKDNDYRDQDYLNMTDFKSGDIVSLKSTGSALGMPSKGAKVKFVVKDINETEFTDNQMDKITISPNPYYVSHSDQKSVYSANKIRFGRLPEKCTIDIYTNTGNLVLSLDHDEIGGHDEYAFDVWDLLSKNGFRIQSQSLIAVITTPEGAQTTKVFSVVVGPAVHIEIGN